MKALQKCDLRHGGEVSEARPEMRRFVWREGDEIPAEDLEFIGEFTVRMLKDQGVIG